MRGRAGAPADACAGGQVARVAGQSAVARADRPLPGGRAGGRAGGQVGNAMRLLRQARKTAGAQVYRI